MYISCIMILCKVLWRIKRAYVIWVWNKLRKFKFLVVADIHWRRNVFSEEFVISYLFNIYFIDQKKQWSIRGTLFVVILASALRKHRNTDCLLTNRQMIGIRNVFSFILLYFTDELKVCKFLTRSTKLQFNLLWAGVNKDIYKMRL